MIYGHLLKQVDAGVPNAQLRAMVDIFIIRLVTSHLLSVQEKALSGREQRYSSFYGCFITQILTTIGSYSCSLHGLPENIQAARSRGVMREHERPI